MSHDSAINTTPAHYYGESDMGSVYEAVCPTCKDVLRIPVNSFSGTKCTCGKVWGVSVEAYYWAQEEP